MLLRQQAIFEGGWLFYYIVLFFGVLSFHTFIVGDPDIVNDSGGSGHGLQSVINWSNLVYKILTNHPLDLVLGILGVEF